MLNEAAKHLREGIILGRTDIIKKLLEEVKVSIKSEKEAGTENIPTYEEFLNSQSSSVGTFLHSAVKHGKKDVVRALLQEGADPCVFDTNQKTAIDNAQNKEMQQVFAGVLLQAIAVDSISQVNQLLRGGLNVNTTWDTEATRNTPLHWAATFGTPEVVRILVENWSADVNVVNANGETPLHESVSRGQAEISNILLFNGADINIQANQGKFAGKSAKDIISGKGEEDEKFSELKLLFEKFIPRETPAPYINGALPLSNGDAIKIESGDLNNVNSSSASTAAVNEDSRSTLNVTNSQFSGHVPVSPVPTVITDERLNLLWPQPTFMRQLASADEELNDFPRKMSLSISPGKFSIHQILDVWDSHRSFMSPLKRRVFLDENHPILYDIINQEDQDHKPSILCTLNEALFSNGGCSGSYRLTISNNQIRIASPDLIGLHYAIMTLVQLFTFFYCNSEEDEQDFSEETTRMLKIASPLDKQNNSNDKANHLDEGSGAKKSHGIVSVHISDQPDMSMRAVLLDLNPYGRVPTMETLLYTIDIWARLKLNQFHAFIRLGKGSNVDSSFLSYSKSDFLTLDRYCRDRFIDFVPALDVDLSITSVEQLLEFRTKISDILTCFDHPRYVHLGPKITSLLYGNNVHPENSSRFNIRNLISVAPETVFILCGNSLQNYGIRPDRIPPDSIVIHYGFQKYDSFTPALSRFSSSGLAVCICTGTAAWSNLSGWPDSALSNACSAVHSLNKVKGLGSVTANWSSHPAFTHSVFAWPGFLIGAGLGWNSGISESFVSSTLSDLLDIHILGDLSSLERLPGLEGEEAEIFSPGRALLELGRAENLLDEKRRKKSQDFDFRSSANPSAETTLLRLLVSPDDVSFDGLSIEDFGVAVQHVRRAQGHLVKCPPPSSPRCESHRQEMQLTAELLLISARIGRALRTSGVQPAPRATPGKTATPTRSGSALGSPINIGVANLAPTFRTDIANKLLGLVEQYRALWLSRYQSQGLQGSLLVLSSLLRKFIPEESQ